ncbi:MAG: NAD(P)-dependent oxidoreductase, partial [bacterium]
ANILAYDPNLSEQEIRRYGAEPVNLEELLRESDIISLNASLTPENYHMISDKEFSLMKDGVIILNTARGELIDEKALLSALEKGKIAGLGLDVVEGEPIGKEHPLLKFENVVITPHISAYTYECLKAMGEKVVSDVERIARGEIPTEIINKEVLEGGKWRT